jgi:hypothetical protein
VHFGSKNIVFSGILKKRRDEKDGKKLVMVSFLAYFAAEHRVAINDIPQHHR